MTDRKADFIEQARSCLKNGQFGEAVEFARQAVDLAPKDADALSVLGAALSRSDMPDEAQEMLELAIRLDPNSPKRHYNLAAHFYRFGWKKEARSVVKKAIALDPNYGKAKELMRRIELDVMQPPPMRYQGGNPVAEPAAPPVQAVPEDYYRPAVAPKRSHGIAFVERMGSFWEVTLVVLFAVYMVLMVVELSYLVSSPLQVTFDRLSSATLYMLSWFLLTAAWVVDLMDRRPSQTFVAVGVLGILLVFPVCLIAFVPLLGSLMFLAYLVGSRRE